MGLEAGGGRGTKEKEEKEKEEKQKEEEKIPLCESIGHRPLRGQSRGPDPSLEAQIPASRPKS